MPPDRRAIAGVDDSKRLSAEKRSELALLIREQALAISLGAASAREVDRLNIHNATVLAMQRALSRISTRLHAPADHVLVDGRSLRTLGVEHTAVVKGDSKCYCIACASIIAKTTRDRLMHALAPRHAYYAWERNSGYGTLQHREAIAQHGLSAHHRLSFCMPTQASLAL